MAIRTSLAISIILLGDGISTICEFDLREIPVYDGSRFIFLCNKPDAVLCPSVNVSSASLDGWKLTLTLVEAFPVFQCEVGGSSVNLLLVYNG